MISMVMSRNREPQQLVRLKSTTLKMAISLVRVTCQNGVVSVPSVCVKSPRFPLMARFGVKDPFTVLCAAVPLPATLAGAPDRRLVSKPTAGGAGPVNQLALGEKVS
jgi:hypothetical protein